MADNVRPIYVALLLVSDLIRSQRQVVSVHIYNDYAIDTHHHDVVFEFRVTVTLAQEKVKKEFELRTDNSWEVAKERICESLEIDMTTASLGYRMTPGEGQRTKPTVLGTATDWEQAMEKITEKASHARVNRIGMEIIDLKAVEVRDITYSFKDTRPIKLYVQ